MPSDSVDMIVRLGGEPILYVQEGQARTLTAVVERRPTQQNIGVTPYVSKVLGLYIARDETDGLMTIRQRADEVELKFNLYDENPTRFRVIKIMEQDAGISPTDGGMWHLEIQG